MARLLTLLFHDVVAPGSPASGFAGPAAARYKLTPGEFEAQISGLAAVLKSAPVLADPAAMPADDQVPVAICVDDGGLSGYTVIADRLEALGWRAHYLVTTAYLGRDGFLARRHVRELHARDHLIGSHSVSHPPIFSACSPEEMVREWHDSRAALEDILGCDVITASVPGGYYSRRVGLAAAAAGLKLLFTSEPDTALRHVDTCLLAGRFALRHGSRRDLAARLACLDRATLLREQVAWRAKGIAKALLGPDYPRLAELALRTARPSART